LKGKNTKMDQPQSESKGTSMHYILKATAVCGKKCNVLKNETLTDEVKNCLRTFSL